MKFEDDLVEEVKALAPPGVTFETDEVCEALVRAVNGHYTLLSSAIQRAADATIRRRREEAAENAPEVWTAIAVDQLLEGLGIAPRDVQFRVARDEWTRTRRTIVEVADVRRHSGAEPEPEPEPSTGITLEVPS